MAADVSTNPWTILAADAGAIIIWPSNAYIVNIEFQDYVSDTDVCQIINRAGKVIWDGNGAADLQTVRSGMIGWVHGGIAVPTITSGAVRIYIK